MPLRHPKRFLIQILVTVNPDGSFTNTVRSYYDDHNFPPPHFGPLNVNVGDEVAWRVQVTMPTGRKQLPYTIEFNDDTFFGVTSVSVDQDGISPFLPVLRVKGAVHYELKINGLGLVLDPDIQSGSDSNRKPFAVPDHYLVIWDVISNTMTYVLGTTPINPQPFPPGGLKLKAGDDVSFQASIEADDISGFAIVFPENGNGWATPFDPDSNRLMANAMTPTVIEPKEVDDPNDANNSFPFTATIKADGTTYTFPGSADVKFKL